MRRRRTIVLSLLAGAFVLTAAGELLLRRYRQKQLFAPSPDPVKSWDPADYGIPAGATEEVRINTPDGETLHGWYCRAKQPVASALFCHGNTGNLTVSADIIPHLLDAGLSILFFDYRGFGKSTGVASIDGVVADGLTAARFHDTIRPKDLPTILYGFSLGGGVATQVIRKHPFDGLILQSTFTSIRDVTRLMHSRLPLHLVAGGLFDSLSVVKNLTVPLLVIHGESDEVLPCWMAHKLYDACPAPKRIEVIQGGLHKDVWLRGADDLVWSVNRFATALKSV